MQPQRAPFAGMALLALAAVLVIGMFTKGWGRSDQEGAYIKDIGERVDAGLFGFDACKDRDRCESLSWEELTERFEKDDLAIPDAVAVSRVLGIAAGFAALASMLVVAGFALANRLASAPMRFFAWSQGTATICLGVFAIQLALWEGFGFGYSSVLAVSASSVAAIVGRRPMHPRQPAQLFCPHCGRPARYIAEQARHGCDACQQYLPG